MYGINFKGSVLSPSKVVCVGKNYTGHIREMESAVPDEMVVFMKPSSAIGDQLRSHAGETLHYECEICLLIVDQQIAGVGVGLDLTKRELQGRLKKAGLPWERSKAFDGAALFSPFVSAPENLAGLSLELRVDGSRRQYGGVAEMLYSPMRILDELATFMTLETGDVVMTGTPSGVGPVVAGAHFEARLFNDGEALTEISWLAR